MALSKSKGDGKKKSSGFVYKERTEEMAKAHAERQGARFDSMYKGGVQLFKAHNGWNNVRICPPTWDDPQHYAFSAVIHRNIGPDHATYLCLSKNDWHEKGSNNKCPCCDLYNEIKKEGGDEAAAKSVNRQEIMVSWILDREGDDPEQPIIWPMSYTMDKDIQALTFNRRGGVTKIDHPDNGNDIEFRRNGTGLKTRYNAHKLSESCELCDTEKAQDRVLEFLVENPIPEQFRWYDASYLQKVIEGMSAASDPDDRDPDDRARKTSKRDRTDDDDEADEGLATKRTRSSRKDEVDDEEEKPRAKKRRGDEDDEVDEKPRGKKRRAEPDPDDEEDPLPDVEEKPRAKQRRADPDEDEPEEKPRGKSRRADPDDEEDPEPDSGDDDEPEEKPRSKRGRAPDPDDEVTDEKPRTRRKADPDDEDDVVEEKPRSKRRADPDEADEEDKPRSRKRADPDEDDEADEKPRGKRRADPDEEVEEDRPRRKRR